MSKEKPSDRQQVGINLNRAYELLGKLKYTQLIGDYPKFSEYFDEASGLIADSIKIVEGKNAD